MCVRVCNAGVFFCRLGMFLLTSGITYAPFDGGSSTPCSAFSTVAYKRSRRILTIQWRRSLHTHTKELKGSRAHQWSNALLNPHSSEARVGHLLPSEASPTSVLSAAGSPTSNALGSSACGRAFGLASASLRHERAYLNPFSSSPTDSNP